MDRRKIPGAREVTTANEARIPCEKRVSLQTEGTMKNPSHKTQVSEKEHFTHAEAQVSLTARQYNATTASRQQSLLLLCRGLGELKLAYTKLPAQERPEETWREYVAKSARELGLGFRTARQADLYIKLGKEFDQVPEAVHGQKLAGCSSYREIRQALDRLNQPPSNPPTTQAFGQLVSRFLKMAERVAGQAPTPSKSVIEQAVGALRTVLLQATDTTSSENHLMLFRPKTVAEIADLLGGKTALGRAVGKENGHASYWVRTNRFPTNLRSQLVQAVKGKRRELDLSLIEATAA
jgi:hypothetical protein